MQPQVVYRCTVGIHRLYIHDDDDDDDDVTHTCRYLVEADCIPAMAHMLTMPDPCIHEAALGGIINILNKARFIVEFYRMFFHTMYT